MRSQIRDEKDIEYIKTLSRKDRQHWATINRRDTFRDFRYTLTKLDLSIYIPMNLVVYTHSYCKQYGDPSIERIKRDPRDV